LLAKPTQSRPQEPLRYIADIAGVVRARVFESAVDRFIKEVIGQLRAENVASTNLDQIWGEVLAERSVPGLASRRKLEALMGFDPDEAEDEVIEALLADAHVMGRQAMDEVAADRASQGGAVVTTARLSKVAKEVGFDTAPRETVRLGAGTVLPPIGESPVAEAARALRAQERLGTAPIENSRLAQMAGVRVAALRRQENACPVFSFALDETPDRGWVALRLEMGDRTTLRACEAFG
jgi:hypothetical protein